MTRYDEKIAGLQDCTNCATTESYVVICIRETALRIRLNVAIESALDSLNSDKDKD